MLAPRQQGTTSSCVGLPVAALRAKENRKSRNIGCERENQRVMKSETYTLLRRLVSLLVLKLREKAQAVSHGEHTLAYNRYFVCSIKIFVE